MEREGEGEIEMSREEREEGTRGRAEVVRIRDGVEVGMSRVGDVRGRLKGGLRFVGERRGADCSWKMREIPH